VKLLSDISFNETFDLLFWNLSVAMVQQWCLSVSMVTKLREGSETLRTSFAQTEEDKENQQLPLQQQTGWSFFCLHELSSRSFCVLHQQDKSSPPRWCWPLLRGAAAGEDPTHVFPVFPGLTWLTGTLILVLRCCCSHSALRPSAFHFLLFSLSLINMFEFLVNLINLLL